MNFIEVLEYLRQSPTNCVTHEEWLTKENKAIRFIGCFNKINIDQLRDIGDIPSRFSDINLMLSNRWLKLQDWHKSKKEHTELHTFKEAYEAYKDGCPIKRLDWNGYMGTYYSTDRTDVTRAVVRFSMPDIEAKDWLIEKRDK
jgi:hypothetical protein